MSVLVYIEHSEGTVKNPILQAVSLAKALADKMGTDLVGVSIGDVNNQVLEGLGKYGVSKVHKIGGNDAFDDRVYAAAVAEVAKATGANATVFAQTYDGKALAPRVSIKLDAALMSGIMELPDPSNGFQVKRLANSGKGIATLKSHKDSVVLTVKPNSFKIAETGGTASVEDFAFSGAAKGAVTTGIEKAAGGISITEAATVVSGGRGLKGPENWNVLLELAEALGAGTACSKPVADMDWRPHHEHVGQTGIQIGPNLYIAMGISGAIQHLAGVNSSKNIVVINKDPEAPFFKIADYGVVADLFEVVPKMTARVKELKASS